MLGVQYTIWVNFRKKAYEITETISALPRFLTGEADKITLETNKILNIEENNTEVKFDNFLFHSISGSPSQVNDHTKGSYKGHRMISII